MGLCGLAAALFILAATALGEEPAAELEASALKVLQHQPVVMNRDNPTHDLVFLPGDAILATAVTTLAVEPPIRGTATIWRLKPKAAPSP